MQIQMMKCSAKRLRTERFSEGPLKKDGFVEPDAMVQIGLRATGYSAEDFDWARSQGVQVVQAEDC